MKMLNKSKISLHGLVIQMKHPSSMNDSVKKTVMIVNMLKLTLYAIFFTLEELNKYQIYLTLTHLL